MATSFFDGRSTHSVPEPKAVLADPADVAGLVVGAIMQPAGIEVKELPVETPGEASLAVARGAPHVFFHAPATRDLPSQVPA